MVVIAKQKKYIMNKLEQFGIYILCRHLMQYHVDGILI